MNNLGMYEVMALNGLRTVRRGPWDVLDLVDLEQVFAEGMRDSRGFTCEDAAVCDWLRSLSAEDRNELVERLNENHRPTAGHDPASATG